MKNVTKIMGMLVMVVIALGFTSCSSNGGNTGTTAELEIHKNETTGSTVDVCGEDIVSFCSANKFFNRNTNEWSDGYLFADKENFYIVVYNYNIINNTMVNVTKETKTIAKNSIAASAKYNAVMCTPNGEILPGVLNISRDSWTIVGESNTGKVYSETHMEKDWSTIMTYAEVQKLV